MPRSVQAFPQNAVVTNSPANVTTSDPTQAITDGATTFQIPNLLDICAGVTTGTQNPFLSGLGTMGAGGNNSGVPGQTGSMLSGLQAFADMLCGLTGGTGSNTTPQTITTGAQNVSNAINNSPMASGTIALGGSSGNNALDAINGMQSLANMLYSIFSLCGCGGANAPSNVTPQQVVNTAQSTANAVTGSPFASGMIALGQANGSTGNVALDAINGVQSLANSLYSILSLCGCGGANAPANVTPQQVIATAQTTADAVTANPLASAVLASGLPGSGGNAAIAALNGVVSAALAIQNDVNAASTLAQDNKNAIALQAINNANYHGVDPSLNAVFNITVLTASTPDTVTVTAEASTIGFINIPTSTTKTYAVLIGYTTGTVSAAYINLYTVSTTTGALTWVQSSPNVVSSISGALGWSYVLLSPSVAAMQGEWFAVEVAVVGTGSLTLVGMPNHWLVANPNVYPAHLSAMRALTIFDGSVTYGSTGSVTTGSWTHVIGGLATAIFVVLDAAAGGGSPTATVGSTGMTLLKTFAYSGGTLYVWVLYSPPSGSQTITFTGLTSSFVSAVSTSFNGITGAGTPITTSGSGTAMSQTATGSVGGLLLQAFGYSAGTGTISAYNQTIAGYEPGSGANHDPLMVGYTTATGSAQSFTATGSISDPWGAVAIPLTGSLPALAAPSSIAAPTYSANVPWLALSSQIPPPLSLQPAAAPLQLTAGQPYAVYPGAPAAWPYVSSAATLTLTAIYTIYVFTGSSTATWTLPPAAPNTGLVLFLYNRGTAAVTVTCAGTDQIDNFGPTVTSITLLAGASTDLTCDGIYWLNFG